MNKLGRKLRDYWATLLEKSRTKFSIWKANSWHRFYKSIFFLQELLTKYRILILVSILLVLIGLSIFSSIFFENELDLFTSNYITNQAIDDFKVLLVSIGGALVGAGAISFSLVMFVLQVNIERMPHELFGKFSSDKKIISIFTFILFLSFVIVLLSLIVTIDNLLLVGVSSFWSVILVVVLVIAAYRRSIILISPIHQLDQILDDAKLNFSLWYKRAERARPLLKSDQINKSALDEKSTDFELMQYYQINSNWTRSPQKGIDHAISYSRKYAENGDYFISGHALNVIVAINELYIKSKGQTFIAANPFFKHSLSQDSFINTTLEHFRKNLSFAIARKDEQQIEQTLQALHKLALIYAEIDYSQHNSTKTHAQLAIIYLSDGIKSALRHDYTDVVMEGLRLLGSISNLFVKTKSVNEVASIIQDISFLSAGSAVKEHQYPATSIGVEILSILTIQLIQSEGMNVRFLFSEIRKNISSIAKTILKLSSQNSQSIHTASLASYYSGTATDTLLFQLGSIINSLITADHDDEEASNAIINIEIWADGIFKQQKELLLLAIKIRSFFTFDIINWITEITKMLLVISTAKACPLYLKDKLQEHALWLFSTLSWINDDQETIDYVASFDLLEKHFEVIYKAREVGGPQLALKYEKQLFDWTFIAGRYQNGWGLLERSLYALVVIAMTSSHDSSGKILVQRVKDRLSKIDIDDEVLLNTASHILEKASHLYNLNTISLIERNMAKLNKVILIQVLESLAKVLFQAYKEKCS